MPLDENLNEYPWLLFKLYGVAYAVSSKEINAISHLPSAITIVPDKDDHIRGVMEFRGAHIKLIDLRALLGIDSMDSELEKFSTMIDERKQDHINWIDELERCVKNGEQFKLATNPHKCKFGKWYDTYHTKSNNIKYILGQIEEPHEKFHSLAREISAELNSKNAQDHKSARISELLRAGRDEYMPKILGLMDEAKAAVSTHIQEMVIAFEHPDGTFFGVIVDEVLSVDEIELLNGNNTNNAVLRSRFIEGIARTIKTKELVLMLSYKELFDV